jgi:thioredoxin reductase (NADPH)
VLIIGSGPAGYTAAVYAARAMLNPILVYGIEPGGQMTTTTDVENYPGFAGVIQGPWLMEQMKEQAKAVGTDMIEDHISSVNLKSKPFEAIGDSGQKYTADSIIISTGAQARWLNLKSEQELRGFGVSACATCDGFFFKEKTVAVIGGGNAAVEEAMFLTKFASKVKLIHRRDALRAEKMLQSKLMANKKIEIIWDSIVEEVIGDKDPKNVTGLKIKNVKTNKVEELKIDGLFIAIGHDPATKLFKDQLEMDKEGYLITKPDSTATNVPGVFAAGDVKDKIFRQAVTAAGMGCMSALEAEKFLSAKSS